MEEKVCEGLPQKEPVGDEIGNEPQQGLQVEAKESMRDGLKEESGRCCDQQDLYGRGRRAAKGELDAMGILHISFSLPR